ncbi:MAG: Cell division protein ZapA [Gammaproteobacteria bacterium]|nr:Cell division protein ZapA [Gammaproteobacteria bacterium]
MNFDGHQNVKVWILGKEYSVVCGSDQKEALRKAASHLSDRMEQIRKAGKVVGTERCAIMAALNIIHELLELKVQSTESNQVSDRLEALKDKLEAAVQEQKQIL